MVRNKV